MAHAGFRRHWRKSASSFPVFRDWVRSTSGKRMSSPFTRPICCRWRCHGKVIFRVLVLSGYSAACVFRACRRLAPTVARHGSLQLEGETVCSTQDFACSMKARRTRSFPQFWPQNDNGLLDGTNSTVSCKKWRFIQTLQGVCAIWRFWPRSLNVMPAYCLLIGCSAVLLTLRILNKIQLDYSLSIQVFPIKRPSRSDIRATYCAAFCVAMVTQFLFLLSCAFRFGAAAVARKCARASCTRWCGDTRGLCAQQCFGWAVSECTRLSFERSGTVLCADPPALVGTAVANCRSLRAGRRRTVGMAGVRRAAR